MTYSRTQIKSVIGCNLLYNNEQILLLKLGRNLISFYKLDKDNTKETLKLNPIEFLNECLIYKTDDEDSLCSIQEYLSYYKIG